MQPPHLLYITDIVCPSNICINASCGSERRDWQVILLISLKSSFQNAAKSGHNHHMWKNVPYSQPLQHSGKSVLFCGRCREWGSNDKYFLPFSLTLAEVDFPTFMCHSEHHLLFVSGDHYANEFYLDRPQFLMQITSPFYPHSVSVTFIVIKTRAISEWSDALGGWVGWTAGMIQHKLLCSTSQSFPTQSRSTTPWKNRNVPCRRICK